MLDTSVLPPSSIVAAAIIQDLHNNQLVRASKHYNGYGIQLGIDWETTLRYVRTLRKIPSEYPQQAALETIMCAACWPAQRIHESYPSFPVICPRCNLASESDLHVFWMCPANAAIEDAAVSSTQALIPQAVFEASSKPCMWLRGLLPSSTILPSLPSPPIDNININRANDNSYPLPNWDSGVYYGDGSGGQYSSFPPVRRCGVGLCSIDGNSI